MQMITEVGAEQNTTTIIMMPSEFVNVAGKLAEMLDRRQEIRCPVGWMPSR
jgi:adenine deaminase